MKTVYYGLIGTQEVIEGNPFTELPEGYVILTTPTPPTTGDYSFYVVTKNGTWDYPDDDDVISAERQRRILEEWPVTKQLEAQSDAAQGDYTKLNELTAFLKKVKQDLPYRHRQADSPAPTIAH